VGSALLAAAMTCFAVLAFFIAIYVMTERSDDVNGRLEAYLATSAGESAGAAANQRGLARLLARIDQLVSGQSFARKLALRLAQANLRLTGPEFMVVVLSAGVVGAAFGYALQRHIASAMGGGALALVVPWIWLERKRTKRVNAFHKQLVDVLALVVGSLRGGHALMTALDLVSRELAPPACEEFSRVLREVGYGLTQTEALNNLVERMETDDLQLVVTAVNISHEVGGNLSMVLEKIADTIRERVRLQGEIRVLTTQQRLTSYLLVALPFALSGILSLINPDWIMRLFKPGWIRIIPALAVAFEVIGFFIVQSLTKIEV
jgi:tight adherence protein B